MSTLNLTAKQIIKNVKKKLKLQNIVSTREQHGDFYLNGKYQFKVTMPNVHGGSGSISKTMLKVCRSSTHLNAREYADLVRCPMSNEDYESLIRERFNI